MAKAQIDSSPGPDPDSGGWSEELERTWTFALRGTSDPRASVRPDAITAVHTEARVQTLAAVHTHRREESRHRIHLVADYDEPAERPEFEILGELGTGGMGAVFRARQKSLGRVLALKRLRTDIHAPDALEQFENEARITAILDHPNIVPVHDLGADQEGRIFYSMKLIDGTRWSELLAARRPGSSGPASDGLDLRDHLGILLEVTKAVGFAHSRGILHRDVKPDNVMVGEYGEVLLVDWGLAVALDPARAPEGIVDLSRVSAIAGTPTHMAPETARGDRAAIGTWTDSYLLGAALYEVLYGRPPHTARTAIDAVKVAARNQWSFPVELSTELRPYHEVMRPILEKALATRTEDRFADAREFSAALRTALRNLDSATLASSAQQRISALSEQSTLGPQDHYHTLARSIAALERALESWPENAEARAWLAQAHLAHVETSLEAGDLIAAGTHLDDVSRLPGTAVLSRRVTERAEKLRRRLAQARKLEDRRRVRGRVFQGAAAVSLAALVAVGIGGYVLVRDARDRTAAERNHLSKLLIRNVAEGIDAELHGLFDPVQGGLSTAARWGRDGLLDSDDPDLLDPLFLPLLEGFPVISLITRADSAGREYMIMRMPDGWRVRLTEPGQPTVWRRYLSSGTLVETYTETLDYDPLRRPWYEGADALRELGREGEIYWTPPYIFYTGKQPGITGSVAVTSPSGREFVIGFDVLLSKVSDLTVRVPDTQHGKVFVLTDDDRVIGLPRAEQFSRPDARQAAILQSLTELEEPVSMTALHVWDEGGRRRQEPLPFELDGQGWWAGFRAFELSPARTFWIGVALPQSDFDVQ